MIRNNDSGGRARFVAATLTMLIMHGIAGGAGGGPISADQPLTITLTGLKCEEETDEVGSDRPWLVTYAINFRTQDIQLGFAAFQGVDQGELHRKYHDDRFRLMEDAVIAGWGNVQHSEDILIMVLLAEDDFTGIRGHNFSSNILVRDWLRMASVPLMKHKIESFRNHEMSRQQIADEVRGDLVRGYLRPKSEHGDDLIGVVPFTIDPRILAADSPQSVETSVRVAGDGGRYSIRFRVQTGNRQTASNQQGVPGTGSRNSGNDSGQNIITGMLPAEIMNEASDRGALRPGGSVPGQGPGIPGQSIGTAAADLAGSWTGVAGLQYEFRQQQDQFTWVAAAIGEQGSGSITGPTIQATWHGNLGSGSATGKMMRDSAGRVIQIRWDNGVIFDR